MVTLFTHQFTDWKRLERFIVALAWSALRCIPKIPADSDDTGKILRLRRDRGENCRLFQERASDYRRRNRRPS